jgi:virginiamycin B lyase
LSYTINEFQVPTPNSAPNHIIRGPDGNLWFAEYLAKKVAKITPLGAITEFPVPGNPSDLIAGPNGNLWFPEPNKIGEMTPAGVLVQEFPASIGGLVEGPDGNIWYTQPYGNNIIGRFTPNGQVTEFPIPFNAANIIAGPDGNLWFGGTSAPEIGRAHLDGTIDVFGLPGAPRGLTVGPDGNL